MYWPSTISSAVAKMNPVITSFETNRITLPMRRRPSTLMQIPTRKVRVKSARAGSSGLSAASCSPATRARALVSVTISLEVLPVNAATMVVTIPV